MAAGVPDVIILTYCSIREGKTSSFLEEEEGPHPRKSEEPCFSEVF